MFLTPGSRAGRKRIGGATPPGGSNTQVQYNSSGTFAGDPGLTYVAAGSSDTLTVGSSLVNSATIRWGTGAGFSNWNMDTAAGLGYTDNGGKQTLYLSPTPGGGFTRYFKIVGDYPFGWAGNTGANFGSVDTAFYKDNAAGCLAMAGALSSVVAAFRVYNTTDQIGTDTSPTNFERGVLDWQIRTNALTIGAYSGGTGAARDMYVESGGGLAGNFQTQLHFVTGGPSIDVNLGGQTAITFQGGVTWTRGNNSGDIVIGANADLNISRAAAGILQVCDFTLQPFTTIGHTGWINYGGQSRVTSNFTSSNTTLTAITGLGSTNLNGGRNYQFEAWLAVTGSSLGGVLVGITCTSTTITTLLSDGYLLDGNTIRGGQGVITSTGVAVVSVSSGTVTSSNPSIRLNGMIRVASSGTFGLTLAQSTANNAPQTVVSSASYLLMQDMP